MPGAGDEADLAAGGARRSAFSTRFDTTWRTRSASASAGAGPSDGDGERDPERVGLRLVAPHRVVGHLREVDLRVVHAEVGAVHPREVEQVADEPFEPRRLERDRLRRVLHRDRAVAQSLGVAADRRQRRLQLVADGEEEVPLRLARLRELRREVVERSARAWRARRRLRREPAPDACRARGCAPRPRRGRRGGRCAARARTPPTAASAPPASVEIRSALDERRQLRLRHALRPQEDERLRSRPAARRRSSRCRRSSRSPSPAFPASGRSAPTPAAVDDVGTRYVSCCRAKYCFSSGRCDERRRARSAGCRRSDPPGARRPSASRRRPRAA